MCNYREDNTPHPDHTTIVVDGKAIPAGRGFQPVITSGPTRALDQCNEMSRSLRDNPPPRTIEDRREVPSTGPGTSAAVFGSLQVMSNHIHSMTGRPRGGSFGMGGQ